MQQRQRKTRKVMGREVPAFFVERIEYSRIERASGDKERWL